MSNEQINWKTGIYIASPSLGLGIFVDLLLNYNDYSFLISGLLPIIMVSLYRDYIVINPITFGNIKSLETDRSSKRRHKAFTLIVFIFITRTIFGIIALFLGIKLNSIQIDSRLFIAITLTTILISIFGDKMLYWWFKAGGLGSALENKEKFFNQNDVKILIYLGYFIFLFMVNCGFESKSFKFLIGVFATYVAFERLWKYWQEQKKKVS